MDRTKFVDLKTRFSGEIFELNWNSRKYIHFGLKLLETDILIRKKASFYG